MGTWGHFAFDNDDAADWLAEIEKMEQPVSQIDAMNEVFRTLRIEALAGDIDVGTAATAVAAAEVVANDLGQPRVLDAKVFDLELALKVNAEVLGRARGALVLVQSEVSELAELWEEADDAAAWRASIADLDARLIKAAETHGLDAAFQPVEVTSEDELGAEIQEVYDEMHAAFERLADQNKGDPSVEVLRHLARKIHVLHSDVTHMRHAVLGRLDDLTARIDLLEKRKQ